MPAFTYVRHHTARSRANNATLRQTRDLRNRHLKTERPTNSPDHPVDTANGPVDQTDDPVDGVLHRADSTLERTHDEPLDSGERDTERGLHQLDRSDDAPPLV